MDLQQFIKDGLYEDIREGDHTALATIPADARGRARLLVKDNGVLAGVELAEQIFKHIDPSSKFEKVLEDGAEIKYGDVAFYVEAHSRAILSAERLTLNCMQRMSGCATLTRKYVNSIADYPGCTLLDTRKTTPLIRFLEKWAVRIGGGTNYRNGLYDRIMIKDNHVDFCGGIPQAIEKAHSYLKANNLNLEITQEVRSLAELQQTLDAGGVNRVMFDNFNPTLMAEAVKIVDGRIETEASGGITLETIRDYAATGVQFISIGALTHSYKSLDLSLKSVV